MLHKETIEPGTLELIRTLQADPVLDGFVLAGGTGLALMIGHRKSIDIDLFAVVGFDVENTLEHLEHAYGFSLQFMGKNALKGIINNVFVDLVTHKYPYVEKPLSLEGVTVVSKADIAAMKLNAIAGNGTRVKDFIDVYFLLKTQTLEWMLESYSRKYSDRNPFHVLKSLVYFDDVDFAPWPNLLIEKDLSASKLMDCLVEETKRYFD